MKTNFCCRNLSRRIAYFGLLGAVLVWRASSARPWMAPRKTSVSNRPKGMNPGPALRSSTFVPESPSSAYAPLAPKFCIWPQRQHPPGRRRFRWRPPLDRLRSAPITYKNQPTCTKMRPKELFRPSTNSSRLAGLVPDGAIIGTWTKKSA